MPTLTASSTSPTALPAVSMTRIVCRGGRVQGKLLRLDLRAVFLDARARDASLRMPGDQLPQFLSGRKPQLCDAVFPVTASN